MQQLLDRDLSRFQPWAAQQEFLGDGGLIEQKLLSFTPPQAWIKEVLEKAESCSPAVTGGSAQMQLA